MDLKRYTIKFRDGLTWGQSKDVQDTMLQDIKFNAKGEAEGFTATALRKGTYKTLEYLIEEIKDKEGNAINFSKEWMDGLDIEDGDKLEAEAILHSIQKKN
jgi:hypothetical protein